MNTNLVLVVSSILVTNVISGNNERGCRICAGLDLHFGFEPHIHAYDDTNRRYFPPTSQWIITNVVRIHKASFDWFGKRELQYEELVSSTTNRWKLQQDWVPVP